MKERIKELAEQAEFSENDLHIQGDNFQRFADLLIDECIKMIDDAPIHQIERPQTEDMSKLQRSGSRKRDPL